MNRSLRIAIAGFGKIARDQHVPAIAGVDGMALAAVADPRGGPADVPSYPSLDEMLRADPAIDAVALCTPPQHRAALADACLSAGKHVLLEKPPGATVGEIGPLQALAADRGLTLFATWHSRFAPAVEKTRELLAGSTIRELEIVWKEDVRVWHPRQAWIWQPGGLGVFDPGINALSILTRILPRPAFVTGAQLEFPENCHAPIAARLDLADAAGAAMRATFDWRQTGPQSWDIFVRTADAEIALRNGGNTLLQDGRTLVDAKDDEYPTLYRRFADLIARGESDVDLAPLVLVADAFLLGRRVTVAPFHDE